MAWTLLDYMSGNWNPSSDQVKQAAQYADDQYALQSGGADIHNADYIKQMTNNTAQEGGSGNILNTAALNEYNSQTGSMNHIAWPGAGGSPQGQGGGVTPPTYSAAGIGQYGNGVTGYTGGDKALDTTLHAADAGGMSYGTRAFRANNWASQQDLARQMGFDTSPYKTSGALQLALDDQLKDYFMVNGLSSGWNNTGDARQANATLYHRADGMLNPIGTGGYHDREQGSWLAEHPGILAPLGVAAGGLAAMYSGAGAAGSGAAASGSGGAGAAAGGTTAAGSAGSSIGGTIANSLGLGSQWAALPTWGQGALTNSVMGGVTSGLRGGNILEGALMGGLSGGVGSGLTSTLASNGMSQGLASGLGRFGGSLVSGGVGMGMNGGGSLAGLFGNAAMGAGAGYAGNALGLGSAIGPMDNSLQGILARLAAQEGGGYLAAQIDPRLRGLGGQAGGSLATLFRNS